jgi:hypothetical protein
MWSDNEAEIDLLNVQHFVEAVCRLASNKDLDPVTIGIYGDWGSGKSSVARLVRRQLDLRRDTLTIYFNGWQFEGYEDAKSSLASTILEAIEQELAKEGGKLAAAKSTIGDSLKKLWARIDTLRLAKKLVASGVDVSIAAATAYYTSAATGLPAPAAIAGAAAAGSILQQARAVDGEDISSLMKEAPADTASEPRQIHKSIREFHRDFATLIDKLELERVVVIVDDLDRCLPSNVIETLEAIRLFLAVPKTAFIIAADETQIREAVSIRFSPSSRESDDTGRERAPTATRYLEKLVQVPVHIPPLSHADIHGYLNLLFAQRHEPDTAQFEALCERVRRSGAYDAVAFSTSNAAELLGNAIPETLAEELVLAEHLAPVLALCSEGNPRQVKRFLNALVLRQQLAADRGVSLDRAVAAKLLVLEYFLPNLFRSLAQSAAANDGISHGLALLEGTAGEEQKAPEGDSAGYSGSFMVEAAAMQASERFRSWLATQPPLGTVDIRKYIYFANARFALPLGVSTRLSPSGAAALRDLLGSSESLHRAAAKKTKELTSAEVSLIIAQLSAAARNDSADLVGRGSPLQALVKLATENPSSGNEVIAAFVALPASRLPAGAAPLIDGLAAQPSLAAAVLSALTHWAKQSTNGPLKAGAQARLDSRANRANPIREQ